MDNENLKVLSKLAHQIVSKREQLADILNLEEKISENSTNIHRAIITIKYDNDTEKVYTHSKIAKRCLEHIALGLNKELKNLEEKWECLMKKENE